MLNSLQQKNYDFFCANLSEYLKNPVLKNKYAIFCNEELKGAYDSFGAAYAFACENYPVGEFIIQQIIDSNEIVEFLCSAVV